MSGRGAEPDRRSLACDPQAIPAEERAAHLDRTRRLFATAQDCVALSAGYVFRFEVDQLGEVVRFVEHERRCCPFLSFTLELEGHDESLWLRLIGPAGTRELLEEVVSASCQAPRCR